jgi:ABC-type multidrug transport system ATPase subunit
MRKLISFEGLSYLIPYGETLLNNINLDIHESELLGILGHNGSGKTTLLDVVLGNKKASSGSI